MNIFILFGGSFLFCKFQCYIHQSPNIKTTPIVSLQLYQLFPFNLKQNVWFIFVFTLGRKMLASLAPTLFAVYIFGLGLTHRIRYEEEALPKMILSVSGQNWSMMLYSRFMSILYQTIIQAFVASFQMIMMSLHRLMSPSISLKKII